MPYDNERTNYLGHEKFTSDPRVRRDISQYSFGADREIEDNELPTSSIDSGDTSDIDQIISIDGSRIEVSMDERSGTPRMGFIEVVVTEVDYAEMMRNSESGIVSSNYPSRISDSKEIKMVFPSRGLEYESGLSVFNSWRKALYDNFSNKELQDDSLISYYWRCLDEYKNSKPSEKVVELHKCPNSDCESRSSSEEHKHLVGYEEPSECDFCGTTQYSTDALRIYENVSNIKDNTAAISLVMDVVENLCVVASLEDTDNRTAVIKDGPLAQYGEPAWIGTSIREKLKLSSGEQRENMVVGLTKTGDFADFAFTNLSDRNIPEDIDLTGQVVPLENDFIYENVVVQEKKDKDAVFGEGTYYGKNFSYKTDGYGYVFALTVPRRYKDPSSSDGSIPLHKVEDYTELNDVCEILDNCELLLYDDSVIPIHISHDEVTYSERLAEKILDEYASEYIDGEERKNKSLFDYY